MFDWEFFDWEPWLSPIKYIAFALSALCFAFACQKTHLYHAYVAPVLKPITETEAEFQRDSARNPNTTFKYPANVQAFKTGIYLNRGDNVSVSASGSYLYSYTQLDDNGRKTPVSVTLGPGGWDRTPNDLAQPDPKDRWWSKTAPMGELLAIISDNDDAPDVVPIGHSNEFTVQKPGWLYLTTNQRFGTYETELRGTLEVRVKVNN